MKLIQNAEMHETFCLLDRPIIKTNIDNRLGLTLCEHSNIRFIDIYSNIPFMTVLEHNINNSLKLQRCQSEKIYIVCKSGVIGTT